MLDFLTLTTLLSAVAATPYQLISSRPLTVHEWARRDDGCPADLQQGQYEAPDFITYVSASSPDASYGQQYSGQFTPNDLSTVFSFSIPADRVDATCTIEFIFPQSDQLTASSYNVWGPGSFSFTKYNPGSSGNPCPSNQTTYNNQPQKSSTTSSIQMQPGNVYTIDVGPCSAVAGTCLAGVLSSSDTYFEYFQDTDACPIGLYNIYT